MPPRRTSDVEMDTFDIKGDSSGQRGGSGSSHHHGSGTARSAANFVEGFEPAWWDGAGGRNTDRPASRRISAAGQNVKRWVDSFRRDPDSSVTKHVGGPGSTAGNRFSTGTASYRVGSIIRANDDGVIDVEPGTMDERMQAIPTRDFGGGRYYDLNAANLATASTRLARELKGRHLQMIAIGGSIGTGLFVASGKALYLGGPGSLLIAYIIIGAMLYCTMQALGELAVAFPVAGSFSAFSTRFLDPSWGFAMGWNYAINWIVVLPLEIIAASITIGYWNGSLNRAIFVTIFLLTIIIINLFGVKGYGEAEFVFAIIKVSAVIGFILLGIVINIGGGPDEGYIGGRNWSDPGAFHNGFKGLCSSFVTAAFAFAGTELIGLAAAETINPRKSLPTAIKQVFWRITLFYVVALTLVGLLVPYTEPRLLGAKFLADATASPFVIAIENAGIQVLPSVMNTVILVAVMSVGNSAVFGSSRTLAALADQKQAPALLGYVDRRGRPLVAILVASAIGFLGFLADLNVESAVLDWLLAIASLSQIFTWGSICICHVRFRAAWARAGRRPSQLAFHAQSGVAGSWLGIFITILILIGQFWTSAWPLPTGEGGVDDTPQTPVDIAQNFFLGYLTAPIVLALAVGHKLWFGTRMVRLHEIDIDTGRRDFNLPILVAREMDEKSAWPRWKRLYKFLC